MSLRTHLSPLDLIKRQISSNVPTLSEVGTNFLAGKSFRIKTKPLPIECVTG